MYEKAQHVSARICLSSNSNMPINAGSSSWMYLVAVGGLYGKKDWWLGFLKEFYLVSAQIRHCPWNVLQEGNAWVMLRQSKLLHWRNDTSIQDHISQIWSITGNITQSPNSLLNNFRNAAAKKTNKGWNGALFDDGAGLARMTRSNIGQGPSGFELQFSICIAREETDQTG